MRRFITRSLLLASAVLPAIQVGCVTAGTHEEVVRERDALRAHKSRLEREVEQLGATNESLGAERVKLIDEMESLRQEREDLDRAVAKLRRTEEELAVNLAAREAELAERNQELQRLRGTYENLVQDLEAEVAAGQIEIEQLREGLRLNVTQDILFPSGSIRLNATGAQVLRKVARQLVDLPHTVEIQGHTDNVPIATQRFPSNWELAGARATVVVRLLADSGIAPERLRAVSYGEFHPVASNDTPEGRLKNRRIEIRLQPRDAPAPSSPAP